MSDLLDRLRTLFADLAPRERLLVIAAGAALLVAIVWLGLVSPALGRVERANDRVESLERQLVDAQRLQREMAGLGSRLSDVERRIGQGPTGNLFTTLETLAQQSAVPIDSMEPQVSPPRDQYRETKVQISLKQVTLAQVVNFLHRIEVADQVLSVKSLRVRTRPDKKDLLEVSFTVSSFERI